MLEIAAFYFLAAVVLAHLLVLFDMFSDRRPIENDELFLFSGLWPLLLVFLVYSAAKSAVPAIRRGYTTAVARVVGFYWRIRTKLPF